MGASQSNLAEDEVAENGKAVDDSEVGAAKGDREDHRIMMETVQDLKT